MSPRSAARGFTLIEMIVVVLMVSILASAAMPLMSLHKRRTQEAELRDNLRTIRRAIDDYKRAWDAGKLEKKADQTGYPPSLSVLVQGVKDVTQADDRKIYFLRRLPRDPLAAPDVPAEDTWGLRSYDSPPDAPAPGEDVFDIHSQSSGKGLDGTPYRQW